MEEDDECNNDAPTVVIDTSFDEKDQQAQEEFRKLDQTDKQTMSNIQYALRSIKQLEEEETNESKKKKVVIMSVEEEERLINQINEIRDRIKRGETIGQKGGGTKTTSVNGMSYHYADEYKSSVNSEVSIPTEL